MIVERHAVPIDTSSPVAVVRLLWQDRQLSEWVNKLTVACATGPVALLAVGGGAQCRQVRRTSRPIHGDVEASSTTSRIS
jgi:hypothetical protein